MKVYILTLKQLREYKLVEYIVMADDVEDLERILKDVKLDIKHFEVKEQTEKGIILISES